MSPLVLQNDWQKDQKQVSIKFPSGTILYKKGISIRRPSNHHLNSACFLFLPRCLPALLIAGVRPPDR